MSSPPKSPKVPRRPGEWKSEEKLRIVIEAAGLEGDALGELLRYEGVHETDLAEWRRTALSALGPVPKTPVASGEARRIRELERELLRKDKALAETAALLVLKKKVQGVLGGRGRRHEEGDRKVILGLLDEAVAAGARRDRACSTIGLCARTVARWRAEGGGQDRRRDAGVSPAHKLSESEKAMLVAHATSPEYRDLSPRQIVPLLADKGVYIASESTFYRVLHERDLMSHREPSKPRTHRRPAAHVAMAPNTVWSWDITYLRSPVRGVFYYLYLVIDIFSRKVVAYGVHEVESATLASELVEWACEREGVAPDNLVLHADNGGPMKGSTMLATLQRLGVIASFSRPSVSDDNPFAEAIFRTLKYRPGYPKTPFADLAAARAWVDGFVAWYNSEHLHSGIRFVRPVDRHEGRDGTILAARHLVYTKAKARSPRRWTGSTRNWTLIRAVRLNPEKRDGCRMH